MHNPLTEFVTNKNCCKKVSNISYSICPCVSTQQLSNFKNLFAAKRLPEHKHGTVSNVQQLIRHSVTRSATDDTVSKFNVDFSTAYDFFLETPTVRPRRPVVFVC